VPPTAHRRQLQFVRKTASEQRFGHAWGVQGYVRVDGDSPLDVSVDWDEVWLPLVTNLRETVSTQQGRQKVRDAFLPLLDDAALDDLPGQLDAALNASTRPEQVAADLTVVSAAAELFMLPWELLPIGERPLGVCPGAVVHYRMAHVAVREVATPTEGRLLFCWSVSAGAVLEREHLDAITETVGKSWVRFDPGTDVLGHASFQAVRDALERGRNEGRPYTVLHVLCHGAKRGETTSLCLTEPGGSEVQHVVGDELLSLLAPFADTLQLVVLAACHGADGGAEEGSLVQYAHGARVPAVLGSRVQLSTFSSVRLCRSLYGALTRPSAEPISLDEAFISARLALNEPGHASWASMQLFVGYDTRRPLYPFGIAPKTGRARIPRVAWLALPALVSWTGLPDPLESQARDRLLVPLVVTPLETAQTAIATLEPGDLVQQRPLWPSRIRRLARSGARAIVVDLHLGAPLPADAEIAAAVREVGIPVIFAARRDPTTDRFQRAGSPVLVEAAQFGHPEATTQWPTGRLLGAPARIADATEDGRALLTMSLAAYQRLMHPADDAVAYPISGGVVVGQQRFPARAGELHPWWVDAYPAFDVTALDELPECQDEHDQACQWGPASGRVVFLGTRWGGVDYHVLHDGSWGGGVVFHAALMESLLAHRLATPMPPLGSPLFSGAVALLGWTARLRTGGQPSHAALIAPALALLTAAALVWAGWWAPLLVPMLGGGFGWWLAGREAAARAAHG
jgi:hypothetical protein